MNKTEFIESLSVRLGDRKAATTALDAVLAEIQNAVTKGDKVSITGFGVFEKRARAARTARNPRTGESVKVKKTAVPAFRPGATFKELVAAGKVPKVAKAASTVKTVATPARKTATATAAATAPAKAVKTAPVKTAPVKAVAARKPAATKAAPAPAKKLARAASSTAPRSTTTARTTAKTPARSARAAAK